MKKPYIKITFSGFLSALSFVFVSSFLLLYVFGNILNIDSINNIFNKAWERGFIWLTVIFVVICNFDQLREIIKSAVREKIDSLAVSDIREEIKHEIENDPDMLRKLTEAASKKEKQLFINKPINPK